MTLVMKSWKKININSLGIQCCNLFVYNNCLKVCTGKLTIMFDWFYFLFGTSIPTKTPVRQQNSGKLKTVKLIFL